MKRVLATYALGASLLAAPLGGLAMAAPTEVPQSGYQVALLGHHAHAKPKKHHRLRNAALAVGGALAVRHMIRKHRARHPKH